MLSSVSYAQLGEVAGQPFFNVSIGSSKSTAITVLNSGSTPIPFKVILPALNTIANTTQPTVNASPSGGVIPADSSLNINITVRMPYDKRDVGHTWTGILQVVETSNATAGSGVGAIITAGVAKIVTIYASQPKFNPLVYIIIGIIIIVVVAVLLLYILIIRRRAPVSRAKVPRKAPLRRVTVKAKAAGRQPVARRTKAASRKSRPRARATAARRRRRR